MTNKKPTKRENYNAIIALLGNKHPDLVEFCNHEIELLDNRNSGTKSLTPTQKANEGYKVEIVNYMTKVGEPKTVSEILKGVETFKDFSTQKIAALANALVAEGKLTKDSTGRKTVFSLAVEGA